jgi:hypothetical protein
MPEGVVHLVEDLTVDPITPIEIEKLGNEVSRRSDNVGTSM